MLQRSFAAEALTCLACSPDGAYLAAGGASGTLYLWEVGSGRLLRAWAAHYKVRARAPPHGVWGVGGPATGGCALCAVLRCVGESGLWWGRRVSGALNGLGRACWGRPLAQPARYPHVCPCPVHPALA